MIRVYDLLEEKESEMSSDIESEGLTYDLILQESIVQCTTIYKEGKMELFSEKAGEGG